MALGTQSPPWPPRGRAAPRSVLYSSDYGSLRGTFPAPGAAPSSGPFAPRRRFSEPSSPEAHGPLYCLILDPALPSRSQRLISSVARLTGLFKRPMKSCAALGNSLLFCGSSLALPVLSDTKASTQRGRASSADQYLGGKEVTSCLVSSFTGKLWE